MQEEIARLKEENARLQQENEQLKSGATQEMLTLRKQKKELEKENAALKRNETLFTKKETKWNAKEENYIRELAVLREFEHQFVETEEATGDDSTYTEEDIAYITSKKLVIAGGSDLWRKNLQALFGKNVTFIESNHNHFDPSILRNNDLVVLNITHISHGFGYKVINECKANKVPIRYTSRKYFHYTIKELVEFLKKLEEKG